MASFQIAVPYGPDQWSDVALRIEEVFGACAGAEVTLHQMPDDRSINIEVRLAEDCDPTMMRLVLNEPPWRIDL